MLSTRKLFGACAVAASLALTGCGSSNNSSSGPSAASAPSAASTSGPAASASGSASASGGSAGALSADAHSAATGDIPDTQVFLTFHNKPAGYSMKYPEGWTQVGSGPLVTFKSKNNLVQVTVGHGSAPTPASVATQLTALKRSIPTLAFSPPRTVTMGSSSMVKAVYTTESAPNPVTGKRVLLIVDRYEFARGGKLAVVDLGTPQGVDNVDAYRMMIESFHWL